MKTEPMEILIVSDDSDLRQRVQAAAAKVGANCVVAAGRDEARAALDSRTFGVMVVCNSMPQISGLELLTYARQRDPGCKVIIISDLCRSDYVAETFRRGAFQCMGRSVDVERLGQAIAEAVREDSPFRFLPYNAVRVLESVAPPYRAPLRSVCALIYAVEAKDTYTRRHSEQVTHYAVNLARWMGVAEVLVSSIRIAALVHDVGKIGVPDEILAKSAPLTDEEAERMRRHPLAGAEILQQLGLFPAEVQIVRSHHENWDGTGYPDGLQGEEAPFGARIIRLADSIDAMLMPRSYRNAFSVDDMLREIARGTGTLYDPQLAVAAVRWCTTHRAELIGPVQTH